jgi:phosphoglycerate dehydrogenase-like enzyme
MTMRKLPAIFLMDEDVLPQAYGPAERAQLDALASFACPPLTAVSLPAFPGSLREVEAIFSGWGMPALHPGLLARLPACRVVFHAAGTVRTFATAAAWERGIRLTSAADANAVPVAEFTLAMTILCLKHAWQRIAELRAGDAARRLDPSMPGAFGSTIGLLSLSRTGQKVAERLRALDVRLLAYDPVADPAVARRLGVELCALDDVFGRADVVSCHMPFLPETAAILRGRHFARMKPGASFINTARGGVIREAELVEVLRLRPDLYAVLDVLQEEPAAADSPFRRLPNVLLTPHMAGSLGAECRRMGGMMVAEAGRYLRGEPLLGEVRSDQLASRA